MKDLTGKIVYYMSFFEGKFSLSKVKLNYHVPEEDRDIKDYDEYSGEMVKHIYGEPLEDTEYLYVREIFVTDRDVIKGIFTIITS